jgi:hypothetical protein
MSHESSLFLSLASLLPIPVSSMNRRTPVTASSPNKISRYARFHLSPIVDFFTRATRSMEPRFLRHFWQCSIFWVVALLLVALRLLLFCDLPLLSHWEAMSRLLGRLRLQSSVLVF